MDLSSDDKVLAVADAGKVHVFDLTLNKNFPRRDLVTPRYVLLVNWTVRVLCLARRGRWLAVGGDNTAVLIVDVSQRSTNSVSLGQLGRQGSVALELGATSPASAAHRGALPKRADSDRRTASRITSQSAVPILQVVNHDTNGASALAMTEDGAVLAVGGQDGNVAVHRIAMDQSSEKPRCLAAQITGTAALSGALRGRKSIVRGGKSMRSIWTSVGESALGNADGDGSSSGDSNDDDDDGHDDSDDEWFVLGGRQRRRSSAFDLNLNADSDNEWSEMMSTAVADVEFDSDETESDNGAGGDGASDGGGGGGSGSAQRLPTPTSRHRIKMMPPQSSSSRTLTGAASAGKSHFGLPDRGLERTGSGGGARGGVTRRESAWQLAAASLAQHASRRGSTWRGAKQREKRAPRYKKLRVTLWKSYPVNTMVNCVALSRRGAEVAVASADAVRVFCTETEALLFSTRDHGEARIKAVALAPGAQSVCYGGWGKEVSAARLHVGAEACVFDWIYRGLVKAVALSPDAGGKYLAVGGEMVVAPTVYDKGGTRGCVAVYEVATEGLIMEVGALSLDLSTVAVPDTCSALLVRARSS
jgi:hypothetical protein